MAMDQDQATTVTVIWKVSVIVLWVTATTILISQRMTVSIQFGFKDHRSIFIESLCL